MGNEATSKAEFVIKRNGYGVSFDMDGSMCELFGCNRDATIQNCGRFIAKHIVKIAPVMQLLFNTNLSEANFINNEATPFIYNCSIQVPPGYRIVREIDNISYKSLTTSQISFIRVWITDQHGRPINLRGDDLIVTLSLKLECLVARVKVTKYNN